MLISQLEPGAVFVLTPKAIADAAKRLATRNNLIPAEGGQYQLLAPRLTASEAVVVAAVSKNAPAFYPEFGVDYEVEQVDRPKVGSNYIAGRQQLYTSCDPEVFLEDEKGNVVPGFSVLHEKAHPQHCNNGVFHEDGFQAEFSPTHRQCHEQVIANIQYTMRSMAGHVNELGSEVVEYGGSLHGLTPVRISDKSFVELSPELLATGTDKQVALGCDPSENVWGHSWFTHDNPREFPYRMAGGHIHIGTPAIAPWLHARAERIIKAMDVFCGVPSVALFAGLEDVRRRQFYGRAGEFRYQKHGLEYRTLSNAWLQHPALTHLTFNLARGAFRLGMTDWEESFKYDSGKIRAIINEHNVDLAKEFIEENAQILIWLLNQDGGYGWGPLGVRTLHEGAATVFKGHLGIHQSYLGVPSSNLSFNHFIGTKKVQPWPLKPDADIGGRARLSQAIPTPVPDFNNRLTWTVNVEEAPLPLPAQAEVRQAPPAPGPNLAMVDMVDTVLIDRVDAAIRRLRDAAVLPDPTAPAPVTSASSVRESQPRVVGVTRLSTAQRIARDNRRARVAGRSQPRNRP